MFEISKVYNTISLQRLGIRKFELVAKTQFLNILNSLYINLNNEWFVIYSTLLIQQNVQISISLYPWCPGPTMKYILLNLIYVLLLLSLEIKNVQLFKFYILKRNVVVISSDLLFKKWHVRFTTIPSWMWKILSLFQFNNLPRIF